MSSPTQRSLKLLRDAGWMAAVTEHYNTFSKMRHDLFKFIDVLAVMGDVVLAVQTTSSSNVAARIAKIRSLPSFALWLHMPTRLVEVHGWSKRGPRGQRKLWRCRRIQILPLGEIEI